MIAHASQPSLRSEDTEREALSVSGDAERALPDARRNVSGRSEGQQEMPSSMASTRPKQWFMREAGEGDDNADRDLVERNRLAVIALCTSVKSLSGIMNGDCRLYINCGIAGPHGEIQRPRISFVINYAIDENVPNVAPLRENLAQRLEDIASQIRESVELNPSCRC